MLVKRGILLGNWEEDGGAQGWILHLEPGLEKASSSVAQHLCCSGWDHVSHKHLFDGQDN